jgi:DNA-binding beta-propeller fold protein YncE
MKIYRLASAGLLLLAALALAACDMGAPTATPAGPVLGDNLVSDLLSTVKSGDVRDPLDSTPDLDATTIYFTAAGARGAGLFKVPAAGGATSEVVAGAPFVSPRAVAINPDGTQLFVTDPQAGTGGQIFVLPVVGGPPVTLRGSVGTAPQNVTVVNTSSGVAVYFSGKAPGGSDPAVMMLPVGGADAPQVIFKGRPLVAPDGVAVTAQGKIYVADRAAAGGNLGAIYEVDGGQAVADVEKVRTGNPAGIAFNPDESVLLVSSVATDKNSAQVLALNLSTKQTGIISAGISQNPFAGGVHASPGKKNILAWCGISRPPPGGGFGGVLAALAHGLPRQTADNGFVYRITLR